MGPICGIASHHIHETTTVSKRDSACTSHGRYLVFLHTSPSACLKSEGVVCFCWGIASICGLQGVAEDDVCCPERH